MKKQQIRETAIDYFGRYGYEETKWADVAAAVDIGSTALYHYYESKQHCLYEIMAQTVEDFRDRFEKVSSQHDDWTEAVVAVLVDGFDQSEQEILRLRVMVAEFGRVATPSTLPREEAARTAARSATRDLEWAWGTFLTRGMQQGLLPESDPRLLTRAVLGLYNSIWHWYRPGGSLSVQDLGSFFVSRQLAVLGLPGGLADGKFATK